MELKGIQKSSWLSLTQVVPLSLDFYVAIEIGACFFLVVSFRIFHNIIELLMLSLTLNISKCVLW